MYMLYSLLFAFAFSLTTSFAAVGRDPIVHIEIRSEVETTLEVVASDLTGNNLERQNITHGQTLTFKYPAGRIENGEITVYGYNVDNEYIPLAAVTIPEGSGGQTFRLTIRIGGGGTVELK